MYQDLGLSFCCLKLIAGDSREQVGVILRFWPWAVFVRHNPYLALLGDVVHECGPILWQVEFLQEKSDSSD